MSITPLVGQEIMTGSSYILDFNRFQGGFMSNPSLTELDSDSWTLTGFGPAYIPGGTNNTGDFLPRQTRGGVGPSGVYAVARTSQDTALWFQATGTDFTPGSVTLAIQNASGSSYNVLTITYDLLVLNDQNRSQSIDFEFSTDGINFTPYEAFLTPELADSTPYIETYPHGVALNLLDMGTPIANGDMFYLRWRTDDYAGTGARDEWGLDNIRIRNLGPIASTQLAFQAIPLFLHNGETYEIRVCATDGDKVDLNFEEDSISLSAYPTGSVGIERGKASGGCQAFYVTANTAIGTKVVLTASESGSLLDAMSDSISVTVGSIFFSEYMEGSGESRCLEVYNGTGIPIDLEEGGYAIRSYTNGSPVAGSMFSLTGELAADQVKVICYEHAGPMFIRQADTLSPLLDFDGNDGIELFNDYGLLDFIGQFEDDSYWGNATCETQNMTLVRKTGVVKGDREQRDEFNPVWEWDSHPKNTEAFLGYHDQNNPSSITASQLAITYFPQRCMDTEGFMRIEVCAQDSEGFTQPDYTLPIQISATGASTPIIVSTPASQVPIYGCATFYVRHQTPETISLHFTSGGLSSVSQNQTISTSCGTPRIISGAYDVCGNESQNEYLILRNGSVSLDINDLDIGIIDPYSGSGGFTNQPNYMATWNVQNTLSIDNPNPTVSATNASHRLLNVNNPSDIGAMMGIKATLDALAPTCGSSPFLLPNPGGIGGIIPPNALIWVWLGAGGTGTPGSYGIDTTGLNLNYDGFCDSSLYLLVGERSTTFGGFASNVDDRTYRVMIGFDSIDLAYHNPEAGNELKVIKEDGTQSVGQDCDALFIQQNPPLPVTWFELDATQLANGSVSLQWATEREEHNHFFEVERMGTNGKWKVLGREFGKGVSHERVYYTYVDTEPQPELNVYRVRQVDLDGQFSYSPLASIDLRNTHPFTRLEVFPQPASDYVDLRWTQVEEGPVTVRLLTLLGEEVLVEKRFIEAGLGIYTLNIEFLPTGTYLLIIGRNNGVQQKSLIIKR